MILYSPKMDCFVVDSSIVFTFDSGQILRLLISMEFLLLSCRHSFWWNVQQRASMDGYRFMKARKFISLGWLDKSFFKLYSTDGFSFINQQLSQEAYNTNYNRPHSVMANEIRAEVSVVNFCLKVFVHPATLSWHFKGFFKIYIF